MPRATRGSREGEPPSAPYALAGVYLIQGVLQRIAPDDLIGVPRMTFWNTGNRCSTPAGRQARRTGAHVLGGILQRYHEQVSQDDLLPTWPHSVICWLIPCSARSGPRSVLRSKDVRCPWESNTLTCP